MGEGAMFEKAVHEFRRFLPDAAASFDDSEKQQKEPEEQAEEESCKSPLPRESELSLASKNSSQATDYEQLRERGWSEQRIRAQKLRDGVQVCSRQEIYK